MITRPTPPPFSIGVAHEGPSGCDAAIVCVARTKGTDGNGKLLSPDLPDALKAETKGLIEAGIFKAETGETYVRDLGRRASPRFLILTGLGSEGRMRPDRLRLAVAAGVRRTRAGNGGKITSAWAAWPAALSAETAARAAAEGAILAAYTYDYFKSKKTPPLRLKRISLYVSRKTEIDAAKRGLTTGQILAEAQCFARDLSHGPANHITPSTVAESARLWAKSKGLRLRILGKSQLERLGCGALLGVGRGSRQETKLIILEHRPRASTSRKQRPLLFVGKGVTFDTGGINIKTGDGMHHMKADMAGSAAVIAALGACADLRVPYPVIGLAPMVENMPGGNAQRPGDIVKSLSGLTIEILNTDAEGRLALADAISYGHRYKPAAIIDIATLTGACAAALGQYAAGIFTEDAGIEKLLREASARSGDKTWPMPIWEEYKTSMDSDIADLKNISGGRHAGATTAAVFLSKFASPYRWAHVDMAGPMWSDTPSPLQVKGPTGYGAKLLAQFAIEWANSAR